MKSLSTVAMLFAVLTISTEVLADQYVRGYTRQDGTYVQGYTRSSPDNTVTNNYSYQGNTNPYTGQTGTNSYTHDLTSPNYTGPDSHGNIGHDSYYGGLGTTNDSQFGR